MQTKPNMRQWIQIFYSDRRGEGEFFYKFYRRWKGIVFGQLNEYRLATSRAY